MNKNIEFEELHYKPWRRAWRSKYCQPHCLISLTKLVEFCWSFFKDRFYDCPPYERFWNTNICQCVASAPAHPSAEKSKCFTSTKILRNKQFANSKSLVCKIKCALTAEDDHTCIVNNSSVANTLVARSAFATGTNFLIFIASDKRLQQLG